MGTRERMRDEVAMGRGKPYSLVATGRWVLRIVNIMVYLSAALIVILVSMFVYAFHAARLVDLQEKLIALLEEHHASDILVVMPEQKLFGNTAFHVRFTTSSGQLISGWVRWTVGEMQTDIDTLFATAPVELNMITEVVTLSSKEQIISDLSAEITRLKAEITQLRSNATTI